MAGNLEAIKDLEARIDSAGSRGITKQDILDVLVSQAKVAGTLFLRDEATQTTVGGWNRLDVFDLAQSTQGIFDGRSDEADAGSYWTVRNAAAGDYTCNLNLRFSTDTDGEYTFRLTTAIDELGDGVYVNQGSPYQDELIAVAGETSVASIVDALLKDVGRLDRIQVEFKGPNGSVITAHKGQFGVGR